MGEILVDRRKDDKEFKDQIVARVTSLEDGHIEIKRMIQVNNEMTENILFIIEATRAFWNFCLKVGKIIKWLAKTGTPIAIAITACYHALDAIASHDIGALFLKWFGRVR